MKTLFGILTIVALAFACAVEMYYIDLFAKEMRK